VTFLLLQEARKGLLLFFVGGSDYKCILSGKYLSSHKRTIISSDVRSPEKLLWTLAGIAAALLIIFLGIKLFDGRSPQAVFVHEVIGFRALDMKKYAEDKADLSDKGTIEVPTGFKFPRPVREYRVEGMQVFEVAPADDSKLVLLYLHGGGYCHNFAKQHWKALAGWADEAGCGVVAPNYPLLPLRTAADAHPPVMALYRDLLGRYPADRIVIAGDSAGGGFTLALAQKIRDASIDLPRHFILIAPWVDILGGDASLQKHDNWLTVEALPKFGLDWADGIDPKDPVVSPLYGHMEGLPPTDIYAGTWDVLYTDVVKAYDKMKAAGVDVRLHVGEKMDHVYPLLPTPEGKAARKEIAEILSGKR